MRYTWGEGTIPPYLHTTGQKPSTRSTMMRARRLTSLPLLHAFAWRALLAQANLDFLDHHHHHQPVICLPDKTVDTVLSYYVGANEHPFCMHGGTCKDNFEDDPHFPCNCPEGYKGPHCEFVDGQVPDTCDLACANDGKCQVGFKYVGQAFLKPVGDDANNTATSNSNATEPTDHQYCICPEGFYGDYCQVQGQRCGSTSHCFNGGTCVTIAHRDGTVTDHCDCTTAGSDDGDTQVSYAGRFCQSISTAFCARFADQHNGQNFCVNGGVCDPESHKGCICPEEYTGSVCEFIKRDEGQHAECTLSCENNGSCRKGAKENPDILAKFNVHHPGGTLDSRHNHDFEHCVCPPGFVGLACEFRLDICPGGFHACMHGAKCIQDAKSTSEEIDVEYSCDCSAADEDDLSYAGKYCQFGADEFCTSDGLRPANGTGAFCVNGGKCLDYVSNGESHPGCECMYGYTGLHCEFPPDGSADIVGATDSSGTTLSMERYLIVVLVAGSFLVLLLGGMLLTVLRRRRRFYAKDFQPSDGNCSAEGTIPNGTPEVFVDDPLPPTNAKERSSSPYEDCAVQTQDDSRAKSLSAELPHGTDTLGGGSRSVTFSDDLTTGRTGLMKHETESQRLSI